MRKLSEVAIWAFDLVVVATEYRHLWQRALKKPLYRKRMLDAEIKLLALAQRGPK